jgi:alpha-tubulin suppressor-like RCC1 family protein
MVLAGLGSAFSWTAAWPVAGPGVQSVSSGASSSCAIESGRAYCWGDNSEGQLGDGSTQNSDVPVAVDTGGALAGQTLTQISSGSDAVTCALDSAGAAYCWGDNQLGDLGTGSTAPAFSAVPLAVYAGGVLAGKRLIQISVGDTHACALDSAGAAYCWGFGGLGASGVQDSAVPVAVDTSGVLAGQTLAQISAGESVTCAVGTAGAAYCWGDGADGALGDGSGSGLAYVPVAVDTGGVLAGKALVQVSVGAQFHVCAVDSAGAAYCWGNGSDGVLGDGSESGSAVPVAVAAGGVLAGKALTGVSAGDGFSACALDSAGAAYCWGLNHYGQLGDDSRQTSLVPVAVDTGGVLAGVSLAQVSAGGGGACALGTTGALYCWGYNADGELGIDRTGTPRQVPVLTGPHAPAGVTAVPGDGTVTVSWQRPANLDGGTLTGYTALATPGQATCHTRTARRCTIRGLVNGTTYTITVIAQTTAGNSGTGTPTTVTPGT